MTVKIAAQLTREPTIRAEHAAELHELDEPGETAGPWTYVGKQRTGSGRWRETYWLIVADADGAHWGLRYGVGLTEQQDHDYPWEDRSDGDLPLTRIYAHRVTSTVYRIEPVADKPGATRPTVAIERPDDETIEIRINGDVVASANHDEHGWSGMDAVEATALAVARACGAEIGGGTDG